MAELCAFGRPSQGTLQSDHVQVSWPEQEVARLGVLVFEDAMIPDEG